MNFIFVEHVEQRKVAINVVTVGVLFASFICLCGFTHFFKFVYDGNESEFLASFTLFITMAVSVITSIACFFIFPLMLKFLESFEVSRKGKVQLMENYLLDVVEMFKESIVVLSSNLRIVRGNSVTNQFFGNKFIGRCMIDIIHPADFDKFRTEVEKVMWSGTNHNPVVFEYRVQDPNRVDYLWMESTLCLSAASDDGISQDLNMITRNITQRKQFQLNQEREEALRLKEQINESKLKYISCIAHDLKTPLHSFCFVLDLLKCTELRVDQLELLQQAHVAIDLMRLTISQTMDITKSLTGDLLIPRKSTVKIGSILDRVKVIINGFGSQVPIRYFVDERLLRANILTDEEWFWQMILNLLTNACKYTDQGSIELKISVQDSAKNVPLETTKQTFLLVEVYDTGIGVHPSKVNKLFDAFSQIQEGQTTGTGLGLYGLKARVERLGGNCGMYMNRVSVTGTGSVFWFTIPFVLDESASLELSQQQVSARNENSSIIPTSSPPAPAGLSAFVIDDVLSIRKLMTRVLQNIGFIHIESFENGSKALEAMKEKMVDVVFSDIQMPIMTGIEMIERFREFEDEEILAGRRTHRQYVVALTANGDLNKEKLIGPKAFEGCYAKPVSMEKIKEIVSKLKADV